MEDKYYNELVAKLEKIRRVNVKEYANIVTEDEEVSRKVALKATEQEIKQEIELLLGTTKEWSSENAEVIAMRENINS